MAHRILVLWDIDRTLLYVGDIDRQIYRETLSEIVGRPADRLPVRGRDHALRDPVAAPRQRRL